MAASFRYRWRHHLVTTWRFRRNPQTEVEKRGIEIPSTDKQRYLGTILWRHRDRFVNIEGKGYWLRNGLPSVTGLVQDTLYSDAPEEHSDELPEPPKAPTVYRR